MSSDRLKGLILPALAVLGFEIWLRAFPIASDALAPPSAAVMALVQGLADGSVLLATRDTLLGAIIGFGFGYALEFSIVAKTCLFATLILTRSAVRGVEPRLMEVARALRLSPLARVTKIVLPAALPQIFVAFRLAAGAALIVAVTVEITINPQGLGHAMMTAQQALRPDVMLGYLLWIGIVGFAWNAALLLAQRHLFGRAAVSEAMR